MHFELGHDRGVGGVLAGLWLALDRQIVDDRFLGDHHGGSMNPVGTLQTLETLCDIDDPLDVWVRVVHRPEFLGGLVAVGVLVALLEAVFQGGVAAHHDRRHRLGDLVADVVRIAEHASCVTYRVAGFDRSERDDLGDMVASVGAGRVSNHFVAVSRVEVHVDVGHRNSARVEEAFEQQVVLDWVEVGDPKAVGHGGASGRAAARADANARLLGVADEVPGDQEVRGEPHVVDDFELVGDALDDAWRQVVAPPAFGTFPCEVVEVVLVGGEAFWDREVRQQGVTKRDFEVGSFGHPQRVVTRFRQFPEQVAHLTSRLEVVLGAFELEPLRVGDLGAGLDTQEGVVGFAVLAMRVVRVVGGEQRCADLLGDLDQLRVGFDLRRQPVILEFDEQVVLTEDLLQATGLVDRTLFVAIQ